MNDTTATAAELEPIDDAPPAPSGLLEFDPEDLTLDEIEELEELLGGAVDGLISGDAPKGRALKAIVWIMMRRDNPEATLEDAGKVKVRELAFDLAGSEESSSGN